MKAWFYFQMQIQLERMNAQKILAERQTLARLELEEKNRRLELFEKGNSRKRGNDAILKDGRNQEFKFGQQDRIRGRVQEQKLDQPSLMTEPLGDGLLPTPSNVGLILNSGQNKEINRESFIKPSAKNEDLQRHNRQNLSRDSRKTDENLRSSIRHRDDKSSRKPSRWDGDSNVDQTQGERRKRNRGSRWEPEGGKILI